MLLEEGKTAIECSGNKTVTGTFETKYNQIPNNTYDLLIIQNTKIKEFQSTQNSSGQAKFKGIRILNNELLTRIHQDSFYWSQNTTDEIIINNNKNLISDGENGWENLIRSMLSITKLVMKNNSIKSLHINILNRIEPDPRLRIIDLSNNQINSIAKKPFPRLPHLESLNLDWNAINVIGDGAFELIKSDYQNPIKISMAHNRLDGKGIGSQIFNFSSENQFYLKLDGNPLDYVSPATGNSFKYFVNRNHKNIINFGDCNFDCSNRDTNFQMRMLYNETDGRSQIIGNKCRCSTIKYSDKYKFNNSNV